MITIEKEFEFQETYPLSRLGKREDLLFFDIETTGFSGVNSMVYLIGCVFFWEEKARFIQWFADDRESEPQILEHFFTFLKNYNTLIHFNGDTFDIPFLLKRCHAFRLPCGFDKIKSIDLYKQVRPLKKLLGLESLKQKSIENFLKISREDACSGGQLIEVYEDYLRTGKECLLNLLLLHNEDDLKGMPKLLPILFYLDFPNQNFSLLHMEKATGETTRLILTLKGDGQSPLPVAISGAVPSYTFRAFQDRIELSIRLYEGTLKYFFSNPRDYYYLIYEDTAIHKSVGEYVDKDARIRATRETCYTKKTGVFLPQPKTLWTPEFKNTSKDKSGFFEFLPDCFKDQKTLNLYVREILSSMC